MKRRQLQATWQTEAFLSLTERLRPFESALRRGRLLEVRCGLGVGFGFLLDWLRPTRLVSLDVDRTPSTEMRAQSGRTPGYGPGASFDAAFLMARSQLKRAARHVSVPEVARVLIPGGLLIAAALGSRAEGLRPEQCGPELDRSAEAWGLLHASLASAGFRICEEHLGVSRLLVAQKGEPLASFPHGRYPLVHLAGPSASLPVAAGRS